MSVTAPMKAVLEMVITCECAGMGTTPERPEIDNFIATWKPGAGIGLERNPP